VGAVPWRSRHSHVARWLNINEDKFETRRMVEVHKYRGFEGLYAATHLTNQDVLATMENHFNLSTGRVGCYKPPSHEPLQTGVGI